MVTLDAAAPPASSTPPPSPAVDLWPPPPPPCKKPRLFNHPPSLAADLCPPPPPCKKPRLSNHLPPQPENMTPPFASSRPPRPTTVFYKTRLCRKFLSTGMCPYGDSCSFAHGGDDLRQPMPNWEAFALPQKSRVPGGGNAAGSRRPPLPAGCFRGQGYVPDHIMVCDLKPSGDCRSSEERVVLPRGSAELKRVPVAIKENLKNSGDDAPRGDLPKSVNDFTPVGKTESDTGNKIFKKLAGLKKIAGIYGDWLE